MSELREDIQLDNIPTQNAGNIGDWSAEISDPVGLVN